MLADFSGTLLSYGAAAYASFARERPALVHAQCWSQPRRMFVKAEDGEPAAAAEALALIGELYAVEGHIRARQLDAAATLDYRSAHAIAAVDAFFDWVDAQCHRLTLVPSSPLAKALAYAREREGALRVYLGDPAVAIDTNHLERALRPIPMGRNYAQCSIMRSTGSRPRYSSMTRRSTSHNHSARRKPIKLSGGRYRHGEYSGASSRASARSFMARSAST